MKFQGVAEVCRYALGLLSAGDKEEKQAKEGL